MGIFGDIGDFFTRGPTNVYKGALGGASSLWNHAFGGGGSGKAEDVYRPGTPAYINENLAEQQRRLEGMEKNKAGIEQGLYATQAAMPILSQLSETLAATGRGAAGRGLLRSGMKDKAMVTEAGKASAQLADARASINSDVEGQISKLRGAYMGGLEQKRAMEQAGSDSAFQDALNRWREQQAIWESIGSAGGQVGGAYAANQSKKSGA